MLLETRTKDASEWKALVSAIKSLSDEVTFEAKKDGLYFRNIDPSHVAMIDFYWTSTVFEKFECLSDVKFGIIVSKLSDIIKRAKKDDSVELGVNEDSSLVVKIGDRKEFIIHTVEPRAGSLQVPNIPFTVNMRVKKADFEEITNDLEVVTSTMEINVTTKPDKVIFSGKGDSGKVSTELIPSEISIKKDAYSAYDLSYVKTISKDIDSDTIVIELANKTPMKITAPFGANVIQCFIAPRENMERQ